MKKRILSGMRPTGPLHLGHLVGALKNWVKLQDEHECLFMVADWHALMSEYENPQDLQENIISNVADWLSCGVDEHKSTIFIQSRVKEHLQLYMIFSLFTPLGLLERCPTYKEQLRQMTNRNLSTYGFLGYPLLQAADILLYKADNVPVGEDQIPHLELTRQIAKRFNSIYKKDIFPYPLPLLTKAARFLGLDGRKMSKSYNNYIALSDKPQVVMRKAQGMFTDPARIRITDCGHPDKCNVCSYYEIFAPEKKEEIRTRCQNARIGCTDCKKELAQALIRFLKPLQERREKLLKRKDRIYDILREGEKKALSIARSTMSEVNAALNLI